MNYELRDRVFYSKIHNSFLEMVLKEHIIYLAFSTVIHHLRHRCPFH